MDLTDEALIYKYRSTSEAKFFQSLVRRYQHRIYNAAFRILGNMQEAEEVAQETFIKVLQNLEKFENRASFSSWMFRITHNLCIDTLRANQRKGRRQAISFDPQSIKEPEEVSEVSLGVVTQIATRELGPAQKADHAEEQKLIAASLWQLPESQRAVIVMHDIEGFSYQEIADIIGTNVGTVRSRLHYGRLKLKELLSEYFQKSAVASYHR